MSARAYTKVGSQLMIINSIPFSSPKLYCSALLLEINHEIEHSSNNRHTAVEARWHALTNNECTDVRTTAPMRSLFQHVAPRYCGIEHGDGAVAGYTDFGPRPFQTTSMSIVEASHARKILFGSSQNPWRSEDFRAVDDRLRGGSSQRQAGPASVRE